MERKMKITASNFIRGTGLSAMVAGGIFAVVGLIHPPQIVLSVTTSTWTIVHLLTIAMSFFGLLGIAGIYARQVKGAGWFGLAGFLLLSLWFVLVTGFTFFEAFILPLLASDSPKFAESFLGIFTGSGGESSVGTLATLWTLLGVIYILGGVLFGIATFRAAILSRWAEAPQPVAGADRLDRAQHRPGSCGDIPTDRADGRSGDRREPGSPGRREAPSTSTETRAADLWRTAGRLDCSC